MIWLAILVATWAVYGAGSQIGRDARAGVAGARQRTAKRVAQIRRDKRQPKWKRGALSTAVGTGHVLASAGRGTRHIGRSAAAGTRWGVAEGRKRHAERAELRGARPLSDADDPTSYRQTRDRVLHDRAERRGRGVPERQVRRIEKRDAAEDERRDREIDVDQLIDDTTAELRTERDESTDQQPKETPVPDDFHNIEVEHWPSDGPPQKLYAEVDRDTHERITAAQESGDPDRYVGVYARLAPDSKLAPRTLRATRITRVEPIPDGPSPDNDNGGTTMTAPTSSSTNGNGHHNGEATTISGARAAWGSFEGYAVEAFDTAGAADQEAKAWQAGGAAMLDAASAAEADAKAQMAAAQTLAASLADNDMGDLQAIRDAEAQIEHASSLAEAAGELQTQAENTQAAAAALTQAAARLTGLAEQSQAHCQGSLTGMNTRNARREAFFKD